MRQLCLLFNNQRRWRLGKCWRERQSVRLQLELGGLCGTARINTGLSHYQSDPMIQAALGGSVVQWGPRSPRATQLAPIAVSSRTCRDVASSILGAMASRRSDRGVLVPPLDDADSTASAS